MSILIKNMTMPETCEECPLQHSEYLECKITGENTWDWENAEAKYKSVNCPLVELPTHGRMIDADALKDSLHPSPEPTAVRPIYGSIERYEMDVETGTISYKVIQTNADRIRSMTDEELAYEFSKAETDGRAYGPLGKQHWLEWLKEEVKDGNR